MKRYGFIVLVLAALSVAGAEAVKHVNAQPGSQTDQTFKKQILKTVEYDYLLYLPNHYGTADKKWPLVLFLHGAGERGDNLARVKVHGPPMLIEKGHSFPFILVSPQCPKDVWWDAEGLNALLDEIVAKYAVDENRIYVTGLSMGGYGTWDLAIRYPNRFAAIAPICGGGTPFLAARKVEAHADLGLPRRCGFGGARSKRPDDGGRLKTSRCPSPVYRVRRLRPQFLDTNVR